MICNSCGVVTCGSQVARHRSQNERLPSGYEAPVTKRVVPCWLRGTGHRTGGFQVCPHEIYELSCNSGFRSTSNGLQVELFPRGYEAVVTPKYQARFTGSSPIPPLPLLSFVHSPGSGCRQENAIHKMMSPSGYETTGYEAPVT